MKKALFWLALITLTTLSLMPAGLLPPQMFSLWDKAQHALGFACLAQLGLWTYPGWSRRLPWLLLLHGGMIEVLQAATGWRQGDWLDWLADGVGIAVASLLWVWLTKVRPTQH